MPVVVRPDRRLCGERGRQPIHFEHGEQPRQSRAPVLVGQIVRQRRAGPDIALRPGQRVRTGQDRQTGEQRLGRAGGRRKVLSRAMQPGQRRAARAGVAIGQPGRPRLPLAIEIEPVRLAMDFPGPFPERQRSGPRPGLQDFDNGHAARREMGDEGMFCGEPFDIAHTAMMALEKQIAAAGRNQCRRRKRARRMPAQPLQPTGLRKRRQNLVRLVPGNHRPARRFEIGAHAVDKMGRCLIGFRGHQSISPARR